jgi:cysteine desulfurase
VLAVREGVELAPLVHGGSQERGLRAGTENILGIVGLAAACERLRARPAEDHARTRALRDRLLDGLLALGGVRVNGNPRHAVPGTLNVSFHSIKGDALATALAWEGIAVSTGSACHAHAANVSHVLEALGLGAEWITGAVRFSLGEKTTLSEIEHTLAAVRRIVHRLRALSPLTCAV